MRVYTRMGESSPLATPSLPSRYARATRVRHPATRKSPMPASPRCSGAYPPAMWLNVNKNQKKLLKVLEGILKIATFAAETTNCQKS